MQQYDTINYTRTITAYMTPMIETT